MRPSRVVMGSDLAPYIQALAELNQRVDALERQLAQIKPPRKPSKAVLTAPPMPTVQSGEIPIFVSTHVANP